jgi:TRAP-type transport system periplasmic protein
MEEDPMNMNLKICAAAMMAASLVVGASDADAMEIKFGIGMPEGESPEYQALVRFKEYVEFKTNGEITVRLFPNNQLGGEREMIEMVSRAAWNLPSRPMAP